MTLLNPVGQQLTPTCHHCSTRGGKQEWNLHTEGCSSPCNPPTCGRRIRGIRNRRTDRHTGNHWTITGNLHATPPSKCLSLYHPPPLPQPRATTTLPPHLPTLHPSKADQMMQHTLCPLVSM